MSTLDTHIVLTVVDDFPVELRLQFIQLYLAFNSNIAYIKLYEYLYIVSKLFTGDELSYNHVALEV